MTLYEAIKQNEGMDISDTTYDYGIYFDFSEDDEEDNYDKCMIEMAKRITFEKLKPNWFSLCDISGFLEKYKNIFHSFMEKYWIEETVPDLSVNADSEEFYDTYLLLFDELVKGAYNDHHYKYIADKLGLMEEEEQ